MAFYYYTNEKIKEIDPLSIPESFIDYFNDISDEMKDEIRQIHPSLYEQLVENPQAQVTMPEESIEYVDSVEQGILDKWESIRIKEWHEDVINAEVLVCKIIPDGVDRCKIHKIPFVQKQIRYHNGTSTYGHYGQLCTECMDLYIHESKIGQIIDDLDSIGHEMLIQPLSDTLKEWDEYVEPVPIEDDTIIYIPENWADVDMTCPEDNGKLIEDVFLKEYKDRKLRFDAYQCETCKKIMVRSSIAQKLTLDCGRIGIPEFEFEKISKPKPTVRTQIRKFKPDFFIQNGEKTVYDYDDEKFDEISESETFVVSYSRICSYDDHETNDTLALIRVDEKKNGRKEYLVYVGYCEQCQKYYIAKEDYELLCKDGRPYITVFDDTSSDYLVQSGPAFNEERDHLTSVEQSITYSIGEIYNDPSYVSPYAVVSGGYDNGELASKKRSARPLQEKINSLSVHIDNPYGYRVDLIDQGRNLVYYLGVNDFEIGGYKVYSFNSPTGRRLVNLRNLEVEINGKTYPVKRRRQFDISKAVLYSFMEQSDEDSIFRDGLTDPYLVKVLNMRKKQHQLVDIMFTIQENQNAIVDRPLNENLIVQGCAGSGKTVVMLQRLSALKYNYSSFDFSNVVILTPNDNFNTHINGLASSLQLGYVERVSVENYYISLLLRYNDDFKPKYSISDEHNVNSVYVDFMYSEEFIEMFWQAYQSITSEFSAFYDVVLVFAKELLPKADEYVANSETDRIIKTSNIIKDINSVLDRYINNGIAEDRISAFFKSTHTSVESINVDQLDDFLESINNYTIKTLYDAVYEIASKKADDTLYLRTGKRYLGSTRGTHRYDLYLQLLFALKLYGKPLGTNNLICIDEGQDLSASEYKLIAEVNANKPIFNIYGDTNQLLKPNRGISDWNILNKYIDNINMYQLNENFRNTNQITQFCNDTFKMDVIKTGVDGRAVKEIIRSKFEAELSELELNEDKIAILIPRFVKKKDYLDLEQLPQNIRECIGDRIENGRITVAYVDEVKGIEFERVYVIPNGLSFNEKYIAYSRALSELTVVYDEELEVRIREKEEEKRIAQEKAIKKANEASSVEEQETSASSKRVKYAKIRRNEKKEGIYAGSMIAHTFVCKRCNKTIELSQKYVSKFIDNDIPLPEYCFDCKTKLDKIIKVGTCIYCKQPILMPRRERNFLADQGKKINMCAECRAQNKIEREQVFETRTCFDCGKEFNITVADNRFYSHKEWALPTRCKECRNIKRNS